MKKYLLLCLLLCSGCSVTTSDTDTELNTFRKNIKALDGGPTSLTNKELFGEYLKNHHKSITQDIYGMVTKTNEKLGEECNDKYYIVINNTILQGVEFKEGNEYPTKGIWAIKINLNRCGTNRTHNVIFIANNGKAPQMAYGVLGNTTTTPLLQIDAIRTMYPVIYEKLNKKCKSKQEFMDTAAIYDSKVIKQDGEYHEEIWSYKACNTSIDVKMVFASDGKGGTYILHKSNS